MYIYIYIYIYTYICTCIHTYVFVFIEVPMAQQKVGLEAKGHCLDHLFGCLRGSVSYVFFPPSQP